MKILGIDTTTKFLCLGIYDGNKIYEYNLEVGKSLSTLLTQTIKRILDALGWQVCNIDYFACGLGPGSFTGTRVGVSVIKGLSWTTHKPIIGISTLDILARNATDTDKQIIPIIDAKRNSIYCAVYKNKPRPSLRYKTSLKEGRGKNGQLVKITPYMLLREKEFLKCAGPNSVILGDAVSLYKDSILGNIREVTILDKDYWYPKARNIIGLSLERIRDKKFDSPFDIKPIYLYPKECQICDTTGLPGLRLI
jgi:tRNA threonylcarbamoyladenosine biosynthesis protein TsaB